MFFQTDAYRPRVARGRRRPPGRARGRHSAAADLGDRVDRRGLRRAGGGAHVGCAQRRPVRAHVHRAEGAAGADPRRLRVGGRRDRRRPHHRRVGKAGRGLSRTLRRRRASSHGFPYVLALAFLLVRPEGLFGEKRIEQSRRPMLYREAGQFKSTYAARPAGLPDPAGPHRRRLRARSSRSSSSRSSPTSTGSRRSSRRS